MEIDPRLRSDTSSGSQYPPLHRALGPSTSPPLAPNSSHLSLAHQYQISHDGPHQSVYPPPHTPGNISPADHPRSAHDGTPEDNGANDPKRPRACEACRGLKVRCELDPNNPSGPCKRCTKANRNCVVTVPSRKRQKKTDSRVAELEKKIDALTASLHATKSGPISVEHHESDNEGDRDTPNDASRPNQYEQVTNGGYGIPFDARQGTNSWTPPERFRHLSETDEKAAAPPMVIAGQKRKHQDIHNGNIGSAPTLQSSSHSDAKNRGDMIHPFLYSEGGEDAFSRRPNPSNQYVDVIDTGIISMERATKMFNRYANEMAPQLPVVIFPQGTAAADIRKSKPTLFLAALCAGSGTDHPDTQRVLTKEVMQIFADRIICHGEKTLELVQALLVSTIWYWPPEHFEELKFYQLIHIAAVMGLDINLGKKNKGHKSKMSGHGLWRDHPWRRAAFPENDTLEAKRAWLGCYFMCSASSMGLRRPNLIRWSPYMAECLDVLESSPDAAPTDKFLCQWVRNQQIAEEVGIQFQMDDPCATVNIADQKVHYAMKGFERDLEHWSEQVPKDLQTPTLKMAEHVVNLYMHEVAMHVDHNVEEFKPPFTEESIRGTGIEEESSRPLTSAHIAALSTCLTSIDGVFEAFISLSVDTIRTLPILFFVRIAYAVVVLIKMFFAAAKPNSELGKVINKDNMKVEGYLDGLLEKFRATAADDKSRPAAKFLMVLVMLKTWFHRSKAGKVGATKSDSIWQQNADGDTPAQTPATSSTLGHGSSLLLQQQQQQQPDYSPANTPLQLLSEVATGGTPRPESRNQYSSNEWQHNNQQVSQAQMQQPQVSQQAPYNFNDSTSTNQMPAGYGMMYGPMSNIDPSLGLPQDFDFSIGDGFEQAMGISLGDGDFGKYFQDDAFWGVMMDQAGGMNTGYEAP